MKITLISVYEDVIANGIRIISSCLKEKGHDVVVIFLCDKIGAVYSPEVIDEVVAICRSSNLIGISLMTDQFHKAVQITKGLREVLNIQIIWGGVHPTLVPEECLEYVDMVCVGEGEEAMTQLAETIELHGDYKSIPNIWSRKGDVIIRNELRPLVKDLDSLPFPDYDFEYNHYVLHKGHVTRMDSAISQKLSGYRYLTLPSRGCYYSCTYCCNNGLNKLYPNHKVLRKRSPGNVIAELLQAKKLFPNLNEIYFDDDNFFAYSEAEIQNFCQDYKDQIGIPLRIGGATPTTITSEKLSMLVDVGMTKVRVGIQTGAKQTKALYKRYHSNDNIIKAAKIINRFSKILMPTYDIIVDNPWETDEDLVETLMLLSHLPAPYRLKIFSLTFYPGTELYKRAVQEGLISGKTREYKPSSYYSIRHTYLNNLFVLMDERALLGKATPPAVVRLLTNKTLRRIGIASQIYRVMRASNNIASR